MKLTRAHLTELEQSLWISLTPEQRVILLYRYGYEPARECWDDEEFVYGIRQVQKQYPDHRIKAVPFFQKAAASPDNGIPDGEPF